MPVEGFAAQLIAALEEAQAAASQPKPAHLLAQAAYEKLQFDFPVVSEAELAALVDEFASGKRRGVTARFLSVLRENAGSAAAGSGDATASSSAAPTVAGTGSATSSNPSSSSSSSGQDLVPLYQRLYAVAVLQTLQSCLEAPEAAAAEQLAGLTPPAATGSFFGAEGSSALEVALAAAAEQQSEPGDLSELEHRLSQQEDDDSFAYEPLEAAPASAPVQQTAAQGPAGQLAAAQPGNGSAAAAAAQPGNGSAAAAAALLAQLSELAGHLSYHCMSEAAAWRELRLMQRLAACLAAVQRHPSLPDLGAVAQPLLRLAVDRCVAAPAELEAGMPALLDALGATAGSSSSSAPPGFAAASSSSFGGGSGGASGGSKLQDAFLRGGLLRSLVLLFIQLGAQPGAEPLRCALLLACAAARPLADWATAVPGFTAATAAPELGPGGAAQLHGALWSVLLGGGSSALAALLGDATPADKVPALFQALQLMADVQAVARRPLWDGEVAAALRRLGDTLRQQYSKPRDEAEAAGAASGSGKAAAGAAGSEKGLAGEQGEAERDVQADAAKLALGAEEQASLLAARRAQQLQPACLKLVKDLLQHGGGSGKHD
ncbi:hypothetical protein C2E21_2994 [Chlorella sorokiniana]|uniref:Uncharacterized protein n=1 Tax=Chlorella sorokiniana TaxID=3076 RepID=A0A2P6TWB6_CHLSO|nr:hypothetical protein C2E21_2994 [Chlorella sorokiniana]|eukprot:PRW58348.1 hypothetical protein C2E21_2994 [Chlorella sorokiniana]